MNEAELSMLNEVPLAELLRSIPVDAHISVHTPNPLGHDTRHWAVGALCHDAAARLDALRAELEAMKRWKDAVDDAGVVHWTLTEETANDPMKAIGALLNVAAAQALDPAISSDAAKLRDTYLHRAEKAWHELESARADAERYRWLKTNARRIDFAGLCVSDGAQLDARIDASRKERTT